MNSHIYETLLFTKFTFFENRIPWNFWIKSCFLPQYEDDAKSEEPLEKKAKNWIEFKESSSSEDEAIIIRDKICKGCDRRFPVKEFTKHIEPASKCAKYMFS